MNKIAVFVGVLFCGVVSGLVATALGVWYGLGQPEQLIIAVGGAILGCFLLFVVGEFGKKTRS